MEGCEIDASSPGDSDMGDLKEQSYLSEAGALVMKRCAHQPVLPHKCSRNQLKSALLVVEGRWKALIICQLMIRNMRFHELEKGLGNISRRILTYELRFLERNGIVQRSFANTETRWVEYSLTDRGRALNGVIIELVSWAQRRYDVMGAE
jgi:DNA-binding HxlR family transcriptional regulator